MNEHDHSVKISFRTVKLIIVLTVVGFLFRATPVLFHEFPLNDGGLWYSMINDLITNHFVLPRFTSYNHVFIPFAYPPLSFYLAALVSNLFNIPVFSLIKWLPVFISSLTIPLMYLFSWIITKNKKISVLAVLLFISLPRSFEWLIMGGGLTRSLGMVWALGSIILIISSLRYRLFFAGVLLGLTMLSHPEMTIFAIISIAVSSIYFRGLFRGLLDILICLLIGLIIASPWWATVLVYHGVAPFLNASQTGGWGFGLYTHFVLWDFTHEPFVPLISVLALIGILLQIARGSFYVPLWLGLIIVLIPRSAATFGTPLMALLSAYGISYVIYPAMRSQMNDFTPFKRIIHGRFILISLVILMLIYWGGIFLFINRVDPLLSALSINEADAMIWISESTPNNARFLLIPRPGEQQYWSNDYVAEWFPAITNRQSITTVQGSEWLSDNRFSTAHELFRSLKQCELAWGCLQNKLNDDDLAYDFIFVPVTREGQPIPGYDSLISQLSQDEKLQLVYIGFGGMVWHVR
ncbi:hypothetical protein HGA91_04180 [candidate division WWE3 bacterium]|nr:hypothetical protein [candidate division WWE3 bacterium]